MRTFYHDSEYRCYVVNPDNVYTAFETDFFDGKCDAFIEGYRFVPSGKSWIRGDGVVFHGEMVSPFKDYSELDIIQREYERCLIEDMKTVLNKLGVQND